MEINRWIGTIYLIMGILLVVYGMILALKKLPKNNLVGFRMKKAMKSDENWYSINSHGGIRLVQCSAPVILVGMISLLIEYEVGDPLFYLFLLSPLLVIIALVETYHFASKF